MRVAAAATVALLVAVAGWTSQAPVAEVSSAASTVPSPTTSSTPVDADEAQRRLAAEKLGRDISAMSPEGKADLRKFLEGLGADRNQLGARDAPAVLARLREAEAICSAAASRRSTSATWEDLELDLLERPDWMLRSAWPRRFGKDPAGAPPLVPERDVDHILEVAVDRLGWSGAPPESDTDTVTRTLALVPGRRGRGLLLRSRGAHDLKTASLLIEHSLGRTDDALSRLDLAWTALARGDRASAAAQVDHVIALGPQPAAMCLRLVFLEGQGIDTTASLRWLEALARLKKVAPGSLGLVAANLGRMPLVQEAARVCRELCEPGRSDLSGELAAFDTLMSRHETACWRIAYAYLGDVEEARDIVQTAFLRLFNHRHRYREEGHFKAWLRTTVSRLCLDHRSRKSPLLRSDLTDRPDETTSLTGRSHKREVNHKLREALDGLPERSRLAITLKYFGGASYEDIARILETTPKAVESLLVRTRRELAERLRHLRSSDS